MIHRKGSPRWKRDRIPTGFTQRSLSGCWSNEDGGILPGDDLAEFLPVLCEPDLEKAAEQIKRRLLLKEG